MDTRERAMDVLASTTQQCVEFNNSADMAVTLKQLKVYVQGHDNSGQAPRVWFAHRREHESVFRTAKRWGMPWLLEILP